jgi:hypothetical protein
MISIPPDSGGQVTFCCQEIANITFEQLLDVKRLVDSLGGADQVRETLDALAHLQ